MKPLLISLLVLTGCSIRHTESEVAQWHGYQQSERRIAAERYVNERCYERGGVVRCFDLNWEASENYEVTP